MEYTIQGCLIFNFSFFCVFLRQTMLASVMIHSDATLRRRCPFYFNWPRISPQIAEGAQFEFRKGSSFSLSFVLYITLLWYPLMTHIWCLQIIQYQRNSFIYFPNVRLFLSEEGVAKFHQDTKKTKNRKARFWLTWTDRQTLCMF